jgi:cytidylate kinase
MAKYLAGEVGYTYVDSGAMYRAVTLYTLRNQLFTGDRIDEDRLRASMDAIDISFSLDTVRGGWTTYLNGEDVEREIRSMEVAARVSRIAELGFVRRKLVEKQQLMGTGGGIVMDGRDIGTVVFPAAELKIFITAAVEVRAERRAAELRIKGTEVSLSEVIENLRSRDEIDATRVESPLRRAPDAILLDNTNLTIPQQQAWLLAEFHRVAGC